MLTREQVIAQIERQVEPGGIIRSLRLRGDYIEARSDEQLRRRVETEAAKLMGDAVSIAVLRRLLGDKPFPPCCRLDEASNAVILDPGGEGYAEIRKGLREGCIQSAKHNLERELAEAERNE